MLPIASLTKMMTALVVVERIPPGAKVKITNEALRYTGSGVGVLPRGKWIGVNTMLHGLMLPSGNDAAIALAQRAAGGSEKRFVRYMNEKAEQMGLLCTRFSTPSGIKDEGNHSCAGRPRRDRAARCCASRGWRGSSSAREAILPFPIKGGRLWLYNHNPLLRASYPGTTGLEDRLHGRRGPLPGRHGAPRSRSSSASCCSTRPTPASRRCSCSTAASRPQRHVNG